MLSTLAALTPLLCFGENIDSLNRDLTYHEDNYSRAHTKKVHVGLSFDELRNRCPNKQKQLKSSYTKLWLAEFLVAQNIREYEENIPAMLNQMRQSGWNSYGLPYFTVPTYGLNTGKNYWGKGINCNKLKENFDLVIGPARLFRVTYIYDEMVGGTSLSYPDSNARDSRYQGRPYGKSMKDIVSVIGASNSTEKRRTGADWFLVHSFPFFHQSELR